MTPEEKAQLEEVQVKQFEDIAPAVIAMKDAMVSVSDSVGELKEVQARAEKDLSERLTGVEEKQTIQNTAIETLVEQKAHDGKDVFDVILNGKGIRGGWGYSNPLERALYKTHTNWNPRTGWEHDGKAYDIDPQTMLMNDMLYLLGNHMAIASERDASRRKSYQQAVTELDTYKLFRYELERDPELAKALNTATSGEGADFVPTGFSASLIDDVRLALRVAALFPTLNMPARSGSFDNPVRGERQRAYLIGEATTDSASKIPAATTPSSKITFTAIAHGLRMLWSYDIDEDSAISIMPLVRSELIQALVDGEEESIISGDISSTHQDSDVTAANDLRKSFAGLRYNSGGSSGTAAVDISTLSVANLRAIRKAMGKYGVNPANMAWITSISAYIQMLGLTEVLTMDKWGPGFTAKAGQLGVFDGAPVVVSEFIRNDLNTSGVYDGTTTTDTILMLVNTQAFWKAYKPGGVLIETGKDIETQQNVAVASRRLDFKQVNTPGSGEETVGLGYSLTS